MGRRSIARAGAAVVTGSVAMLVAALPAVADTPAHGQYVNGSSDDGGYVVTMSNDRVQASLINLKLDDGTTLKTYCVQIDVELQKQDPLTEQPWDNYPDKKLPFNQNRDKINWVLHNSYPVLDFDTIAKTTGIAFHDGLTSAEAITATQTAIWHFSDGKDLGEVVKGEHGPDQNSIEDVKALYGYLTGPANKGIAEHENPSLAITPDSLTGKSGDRLGPFTVKTNGTITALTGELPEGVKITDADGKEIPAGSLHNGSKVYLDVPAKAAAGSAQLTVKGNAHLDTGRLFVGDHYAQKPSQTLIVATGSDTKLEASAKASWTVAPAAPTTTPAPQASNGGNLPDTGVSIFVPVLVGVVLVGAGVGALLFQRRSRAS